MSTYPVQFYQLVVKGVLKYSGQTNKEEIHRRTAIELMNVIRKGILQEEDKTKAMSLEWVVAHSRPATSYEKHITAREVGSTGRDSVALRMPRGSWPEHFESVKSEQKEREHIRESRSSARDKEYRSMRHRSGKKKFCRQTLRTQLGGLYSSDSEAGHETRTSSSSLRSERRFGDSEDSRRERRRGRRRSLRSARSDSRESEDPMSPRKANARRDKEYLQALTLTQPAKYAGEVSKPQLLVQWIASVTQYFSLINLSRRDERNIAVSFLEKGAATWWSQLPRSRKDSITWWRELRRYITREFLPHDYHLTVIDRPFCVRMFD